jgi:hypothetical protein
VLRAIARRRLRSNHSDVKTLRNILYWSPDAVRYHDFAAGCWRDYRPVSEAGAMIWCAANNVEFRKSPARAVAVGDVIKSQLETVVKI